MSGLSSLKVLMVDPVRSLREALPPALNNAGVYQLARAADWNAGLVGLATGRPHLVFFDLDGGGPEGLAFVRAVRNPAASGWDPRLPIIAVTGKPTVALIQAIRNAGVNEMLAKPLTTAAVIDRLSRVILKPRPFVEAPGYFGPDRRVRSDPRFRGPFRRAVEACSDLVY